MKRFTLSLLLAVACCNLAGAQEINKRVDVAHKLPVCIMPLVDSGDATTIESSVAYDHANLNLKWNFVPFDGDMTQTAVTPTDTGGNYDWRNVGNGMYEIEMPASGGASFNNNVEGFGWFSGGGGASGLLPFRSPIIHFSTNPKRWGFSPIP